MHSMRGITLTLVLVSLSVSQMALGEYFSGSILRPVEGNELETDYASVSIWEETSSLQVWTTEYRARLVHWTDAPGGTAYELGLYFAIPNADE